MNKSLLSTILMVLAIILPTKSWAQEPYAVLSDNNTVLTFYYDDQKAARNGMDVGPFESLESRGWNNVSNIITTVIFDQSFANCTTLTSTADWFNGLGNLTTITDMSNLKTDNVTNMDSMFNGCSGLTSLDLTGFKTDNVTRINSMFRGCSSLTSLDLSGFKTDNVTEMDAIFYMCSNLKSIDLSNFKTDNVTSMILLFSSCSSLTSLDLSSFKTDNVTEMTYMFSGCSNLKTIYVSDEWSTANLSDGVSMFGSCARLVGGAGTVYDENHIDHTYARIDGGPNSDTPGYFTRSGDKPWVEPAGNPEPYAVLSDNNTVLTFYYDEHKAERNGMSVGPFEEMSERGWSKYISISTVVFDESFAYCTTITSTQEWFAGMFTLEKIIGLVHLNTSNVTNMLSMFMTCQSLTSLDVSNFNTSKVTTMINMFAACHSLENLDVSNFNTSNVTHMGGMFIDCNALSSLDVSHFDTSNVTAMDGMFANCYSLSSLDVSNFNTSNVINMGGMFRDNPNLKSLDLSNFNTENVTDMQYMFRGCSNLTTINVSNKWSTANVTSSENMFNGCESLVGGAGTRYDANHTDHTYAHIDGGENNPGYFTGVDNRLVAYYPFNGNANDESGHGNNGTPMENAALTVGVHGDANGAYQFGGTDNPGSIHVPNSESLQIGNEWSFATYVKPFSSAGMDGWGTASDYGWHAVLGHDHDQHGFSIQYEVSDDMFRTWIGHYGGGWNEGVEATVNGKPMNKWIHIAFTFANNVFRVYINGKMLTAFTTTPDFAEANTKDWYFGK